MNPDLRYKPRNVIAKFTDKYGEERVVHAPKGGRQVRVANNTGDTVPQMLNRAVAVLTAAKIKARRAELGMSQRELCTRAGLDSVNPKQRIHEIENATRREGLRYGTLYALALAMDCEPSALLPTMAEAKALAHIDLRDTKIAA